MPVLTIIRGASGSGKTTLAKALAKSKNCGYFEAECARSVETRMSLGADVIVSNTFTKLLEMQKYLDLAKEYGYDIQVIHCQGRFKNVHGVPEEKVRQMRDNFEEFKV